MLKEIQRSHIGIGGYLRRAWELLYWPRINAEVKDYISKCSMCLWYQPEECQEELQPHEMCSRPWSKVGADIFELGPQQFLIMVDCWSSYFEVRELKRITSKSMIHALKLQFESTVCRTWYSGSPCHKQRDTIQLVWICKIRWDMEIWAQELRPALSWTEKQRMPSKFAKRCWRNHEQTTKILC